MFTNVAHHAFLTGTRQLDPLFPSVCLAALLLGKPGALGGPLAVVWGGGAGEGHCAVWHPAASLRHPPGHCVANNSGDIFGWVQQGPPVTLVCVCVMSEGGRRSACGSLGKEEMACADMF